MKKIGSVLVIVVVAGAMYVGINSIDADPPDVSAFTTTSEIPADEDNAWCGFVAATNAVKRSVDPLAWDKLSPDEIDALVAENADALAIFHDATLRTKWYDPTARREGAFCMFPVGDFARMIRLYNAKAERNIARGEIGAAVDGVRDFLALNRTMHADAESLVCWLVADGAHGMATKLAAQIVASGKVSDEELHRLLDLLSASDSATRRAGIRQAVNNEFAYWFTDALRIFEAEVYSTRKSGILLRYVYQPARTKAQLQNNQLYSQYARFLAKARELLLHDYDTGAWEDLEKEINAATASPLGRLAPNCGGRAIVLNVMPVWNVFAMKVARGEFGLSAAKVVVAAELFRRKTGQRPESLDALVPEFLPSVPVDPFDHGAALKYDAERGIVWTVGADGNFNGEKQPGKNSYGRNRGYVANLDGSKVE